MPNFTVRIDDNTAEEIKTYSHINWSEVARKALRKRLNQEFSYERSVPEGFPWRTIGFKGNTITVDAKLGEFGPADWSLRIRSKKLEELGSIEELVLELGGMPMLDRTIRGVADYFYHKNLRTQGIDLSKTLSRKSLGDLWVKIAKWARENDFDVSSEVALVPPQSIRVHGRLGQLEFQDSVTPKKWGDVKKDKDKINVFFSNLWLGAYAKTNGTVFRLSSYLTKEMGISDAKTATRLVNFNPSDPEDEREIRRLIDKANVVYLPDLSVHNVRSLFYES